MINIQNTDVYGFEAAIRGMRNPMNSWDKSDSSFGVITVNETEIGTCQTIGANDLKLMRNLAKSGNDHGKFARMINVTVDITAPLYWWKEFDTYKVGTVANSCSTMHKIHAKEFTIDDFSCEHLLPGAKETLFHVIDWLNYWRNGYIATNDKVCWWQMIQLLPSSYNQKRTVQLNYQVLWTIYKARKNHKLDEWHTFCAWCETLPHFKEIYLDAQET